MSHLTDEDLRRIRDDRILLTPELRMSLAKDIAENILPSDPSSPPISQHEVTEWLQRLGMEALWAQPDDTSLLCCIWRYTGNPIPQHPYLDRFIIAFVGYDSMTIQIFNLTQEEVEV